MSYHLTIVRKTIIKKDKKRTSVGDDMEKKEYWCTVTGNIMVQLLWKTIYILLKKLKPELLHDPAILLLSINPKKAETLTRKDIFIPMFIVALFTIVKIWQ